MVLATLIVTGIVVLRRWQAQRRRALDAAPAGVNSTDQEDMVEVDVESSNEDLFHDL